MTDGFDPQQSAEEVVALFDRAEKGIKRLELLFNEGLCFHPVNQLRYAGFHIAAALKTSNPQDQKEEWARAKRHCQRSIYDASEMALVYCVREVEGFQDDYNKMDISPTVDNYLDIVNKTREAQSLIQSTDHESRENKYIECDDCFAELKPLIDRLNDARPELNKRLKQSRNRFIRWVFSSFIGIIAILVAVIAIYITILLG